MYTVGGRWNREGELWTHWCEGFYPGIFWLLHQHTGDPEWRRRAEEYSRRLEPRKHDRAVHDLGTPELRAKTFGVVTFHSYGAANAVLARRVGHVPKWNDAAGRTQGEVVAELRAAADDARREQASHRQSEEGT